MTSTTNQPPKPQWVQRLEAHNAHQRAELGEERWKRNQRRGLLVLVAFGAALFVMCGVALSTQSDFTISAQDCRTARVGRVMSGGIDGQRGAIERVCDRQDGYTR